jgi:glucose/arabinose dehydrogenase
MHPAEDGMRATPLFWLIGLLLISSTAVADIPLRATRLTSGLTNPLFVTQAPGDNNRLFILEQKAAGSGTRTSGLVKIYNQATGTMNAAPFLNTGSLMTNHNEQGLLGMAFHPDYQTNGKFYVNVTIPGGEFGNGMTEIRQYTRSTADLSNASFTTILRFDQPQQNHNGGWLAFGPSDGYLYIATGDGGGAHDGDNPNNGPTGHTANIGNAQDTTKLLGKILRIDVTSDAFPGDSLKNYSIPAGNPFSAEGNPGADEIWHYGLRHPWRPSFDRQTHDLYIADVGQEAFEEVNFQPAGVGGLNFGWRAYEGAFRRPPVSDTIPNDDPEPASHVPPIHTYPHPSPGATVSITGGYVYRGNENPALRGSYFFADFGSAQIWTFNYDGANKTRFRQVSPISADIGSVGLISSFGEDNLGRIYVVDRAGEVFRIIPAHPGDANLSELTDVADLGILASNWQTASGATWAMGDFTDDGAVDVADLGMLASYWQTSAQGSALPTAEALGLVEALQAFGLSASALPEPATALVLGLVAATAVRPRHKR